MSNHQTFIKKITDRLQDWDYQADRLEHSINDIKDEAKEKVQDVVKNLQDKKQEIKSQLSELEHVSEEIAKDLKDGIEISWAGLDLGLIAAVDDLKNYLHPERDD